MVRFISEACANMLALSLGCLVDFAFALPAQNGTQELKRLVGLERYTLLMAFLPLTSAISGNVGLQASSLTTRAVSHGTLGFLVPELYKQCGGVLELRALISKYS